MKTIKTLVTFFQLGLLISLLGACGSEAPQFDESSGSSINGNVGSSSPFASSSSLSPVTNSSTSNQTSSSAAAAEPLAADIYAGKCASCHGAKGQGGNGGSNLKSCKTCGNYDLLVAEIDATMPLGSPQSCDLGCSQKLAAYIRSEFVGANDSSSSKAVVSSSSSSSQVVVPVSSSSKASSSVAVVVSSSKSSSISSSKSSSNSSSSKSSSSVSSSSLSVSSSSSNYQGDASRGKTLYESAEQNCVACHKNDGSGVVSAYKIDASKATYKHSSATASQDLASYIADWMPQDRASACVGQCAYDIAAYIKTWVASSSSSSSAVSSSISSSVSSSRSSSSVFSSISSSSLSSSSRSSSFSSSLSSVSVSSSSVSATIIFQENFETTAVNAQPANWNNLIAYNYNTANTVSGANYALVDDSKSYNGSKSIRFKGNFAQILRALPSGTQRIHMRAWVNTDRQFGNIPGDDSTSNHSHIMGIKATTDANNEIRVGEIKGALGTNQVPSDNISPKSDKWRKGPQINANIWSCVEVAMYADTAYDELYMWVDGTLVHSVTAGSDWQNGELSKDWLSDKFNYVAFGFQSFTGSQTANVWMDDIVVSTAAIGCGSSVSSSSSVSNSSSSSVSSSKSSSSSVSSSSSRSSTSSSSSSTSGVLIGNATNGQSLWTSRGCVGCHGVDGEKNSTGTPALNPLNANRLAYRHSQDTQDRSLRDFIALWMPLGNEGSCTGQCAADLEAYIWTWRKSSDGIPDNPSTAFSCPTTGPTYGQRTLRLLTKNEYQQSVRDLVSYQQDLVSLLPDDFVAGSFVNNNTLFVDKTRYTSYLANAERIATDVATRWNAVLGCTPSTSCASTLVNTLGPRIFRRPLTTEEQTAYLAVANGTTGDRSVTDGMQVALAAMLSSPQFLYRSEIGELSSSGIYKLTGYEMATYMSYTFTGTTPGASLMSAAANGSLNTVAGIRTQASSLLDSANTKVLLGDLVNRWLATDKLETLTKTNVSSFATLGAAMKSELGKNFSYAMLNSSSTFTDIYNPSYTHINSQLASHYGLSMSGSTDADGFARVTTSERGGILASGAFMSRYASTTDSNMITRAVAVRRKLMCQDIPEPPAGVSLDRDALAARDAAFFNDPKTTQHMIFDRITAGSSCSNCHGEIINPLGGSMENFDTAGRIRSVDLKGNAIVATGTFYSPYPQLQFMNDPDRVIYSPAITMNGARDVARIMTEHSLIASQAQTCLATQFMSYSSGIHSIFLIDSTRDVGYARISKNEENAYRCDIANLKNVLVNSGPRAMLQEIPALNSVIYRQEWAR